MTQVWGRFLGLVLSLFVLCFAHHAAAGAWPTPAGETLIFTKYETASADRAFDAAGNQITLSHWSARELSVFVEHGLTSRITLYAKANAQDLTTPIERFSGLGSLEVGGRFTFWKSDWSVLAVGGGIEGLGKGRHDDFDSAGSKSTDTELRAYGGTSFKLWGINSFVDAQLARRVRSNDANQWRVDVTLGLKPSKQWLILLQTYSGQTDRASWGRATWGNQELSLVRHFGPKQSLSLQLGVRRTLYGENVPRVRAVSLSLWKRF